MAKGYLLPGTPVVLPELVTFLLSVGNDVSANGVSRTTGWGKAWVGAGAFARVADQSPALMPYFTPFEYTRIGTSRISEPGAAEGLTTANMVPGIYELSRKGAGRHRGNV
jgi:hypothetical protein